jgi:hypothetical protein
VVVAPDGAGSAGAPGDTECGEQTTRSIGLEDGWDLHGSHSNRRTITTWTACTCAERNDVTTESRPEERLSVRGVYACYLMQLAPSPINSIYAAATTYSANSRDCWPAVMLDLYLRSDVVLRADQTVGRIVRRCVDGADNHRLSSSRGLNRRVVTATTTAREREYCGGRDEPRSLSNGSHVLPPSGPLVYPTVP